MAHRIRDFKLRRQRATVYAICLALTKRLSRSVATAAPPNASTLARTKKRAAQSFVSLHHDQSECPISMRRQTGAKNFKLSTSILALVRADACAISSLRQRRRQTELFPAERAARRQRMETAIFNERTKNICLPTL